MKILIVDDDKFSRFVLRGICRQEPGIEVAEAASGREAWRHLDQSPPPDLCIVDIAMADHSGLEFLRRLRADPRFKGLRVILGSAVNDRTTIAHAAALSSDPCILKPYSRSLILAQLRKLAPVPPSPQPLEDPTTVCSRLGIDADTYLYLRRMLADELRSGLREVRLALDQADLEKAGARLGALKGAGANLGATAIVSRIAKIETLLLRTRPRETNAPRHAATGTPRSHARSVVNGHEIGHALDELEAESSWLQGLPTRLDALGSQDSRSSPTCARRYSG